MAPRHFAVAGVILAAQSIHSAELSPAHRSQVRASQAKFAPPVAYWPLEEVEPPRTVRASAWRSPYCTQWHDGCEVCERATANDQPRCEQARAAAECRRHAVMCSKVDVPARDKVCGIWSSYSLSLDQQRRLMAGETIRAHFGGGLLNDWARSEEVPDFLRPRVQNRGKGRRIEEQEYTLVPAEYMGPLTITLQSVKRILPEIELGITNIETTYCRASYLDHPPRPAN